MKKKLNRFRQYNRSRKIRAINFNSQSSTLFFKVLPYLLHCNYPDLPGFVDDPCCKFGIHRFLPDQVLDTVLFRRYFPESSALSIKTPSPYAVTPYIHSLKTIGSIGTVAQAAKSDCDYWVSVRYEELGEEGLQLLDEKCRLIAEWATKYGLEVYFFLMDIDQTRENRFESSAEEESAGSALKRLLKDELFRTHILVAGKMLLWWLIPPGLSHDEYRRHVETLPQNGVSMDNYIDLGYLSDIPKSEIFGACLWQLNKALDSPFKSVIKFAYLELLLLNKEDTLPLFSSKILCMVTFPELLPEGEPPLEITAIDPYLLLARDIVAFYQQSAASHKDDNLIRECLFLKTLEGMKSQKKSKHLQQTMDLMKTWNLLPEQMVKFLHIRNWRYHDLLASGADVHNYLLSTYKRLRLFFPTVEQGEEQTITQRDISILGRKLFTFYEKKPHKIEYIRSLSRDIMCQKAITFHITRYQGTIYYYAFQGEQTADSIKENLELQIKRDTNILTLTTWLVVNGILQKSTEIYLTKNYQQLNLIEIRAVTGKLFRHFPLINFSKIPARELLKKERITKALAIINFHKLPVRGEKELHSSLVSLNNYGEHFIHHYITVTQLKNEFRQLLTRHYVSRWNDNLDIFIPPQTEQYFIEEMLKN